MHVDGTFLDSLLAAELFLTTPFRIGILTGLKWEVRVRDIKLPSKGDRMRISIGCVVLLIGALTARTAVAQDNIPQPPLSTKVATPATSQPDFILQNCKETEQVSTIFGGISPEYMIKNYIQNRSNRPVELTSIKNVTVIKLPTHGKLIDNGLYIPEPNYFGKDKVLFMAEFEGKRYKIILDIHVVTKVDEGDSPTTTCPPPKLIKVNGK